MNIHLTRIDRQISDLSRQMERLRAERRNVLRRSLKQNLVSPGISTDEWYRKACGRLEHHLWQFAGQHISRKDARRQDAVRLYGERQT